MEYGVWRVERRDSADRDEFARSALAYCRAVRHMEGVDDCRFYWKPVDQVVIIAQGASADAWNTSSPELAAATFDLYDHGRAVGYEQWLDAKTGEEIYRSAGR